MDKEINKNRIESASKKTFSSSKNNNNNRTDTTISNDLNKIIQNQITSFIKSSSSGIDQQSNNNTNTTAPKSNIINRQLIEPMPTDMKQNLQGILKHSKSTIPPSTVPSTSIPPQLNSFMVDGKEIVIIDKEFIQESTKNQNDVTVVKNPQNSNNMELAEALGKGWPDAAGLAGQILNSDRAAAPAINSINNSNSINTNMINNHQSERNKSINPLSHFISVKRPIDRKNRGNSVDSGIESNVSTSGQISGTLKKKQNATAATCYNNTNNHLHISHSASNSVDESQNSDLQTAIPGTGLGVGSMIEVITEVCDNLYGVIRWIGSPHGMPHIMVGVELEDEVTTEIPLELTNGTFGGRRYFKCAPGKALFIDPKFCSVDRRFDNDLPPIITMQGSAANSTTNNSTKTITQNPKQMFGQMDCPIIPGRVAPLKILNLKDLEDVAGTFKGIQGHHNSCYLDATLFAMFTFTSVFDSLLFRNKQEFDIIRYDEVQTVLRDEIVNPLRHNTFVRADRVLKLRQILEEIASVTGLTNEEKDPEEFLNILLSQVMKADPFLQLSSGQDAFYYQLFVEKDKQLSFPTVQQLFEQSFFTSDIKLKEVPSCLIIQMPRFGKNYKMYSRILPTQLLDVTDIIENSPRQCGSCGKLATYECKECFYEFAPRSLQNNAFCEQCKITAHKHEKRINHVSHRIDVPTDYITVESVPRILMELFAVLCIETSHYVAFVKAGPGTNAPWCFFDSMADRKGGQSGYNIPEMIPVPDMSLWLSEEDVDSPYKASANDKFLPEHAKRLLCDAYMCMYQSSDVMMYK